jgi:hypothetical protein
MAGADEVDRLDRAGRVEMRIVASGARRDLGQLDAAVVTLQCPELQSTSTESWSARLKFAYADALLAAGREDEAREWFAKTVDVDEADETDASERLADLDGIVWVDTLDGDDESGDSDEDDDNLDAELDEFDDDDDLEDELDELGTERVDSEVVVADLAVVAGDELDDSDGDEIEDELEDEIDEDNLGEFAPPALDEVADEPVVAEPSIEDLANAGDDPTGGYAVTSLFQEPPAQDASGSTSD